MAGSRSILDFLFSRTNRDTLSYDLRESTYQPEGKEASNSDDHELVWNAVRHATMTSQARVIALCDAVEHVVNHGVAGDIVECGVWKGGSMMAAANTLMLYGKTDRRLWLYDTFAGMNPPTQRDVDYLGKTAATLLDQSDPQQSDSVWCCAGLEEVQENMRQTGYPVDKLQFVVGEVETTLVPDSSALEHDLPEKIAILRLDTDWYESTRVALEVLYPRLSPGGVLIVDDYGHWKGCREAVDEYFDEHGQRPFFNRIDYTGRLAVKCLTQSDLRGGDAS